MRLMLVALALFSTSSMATLFARQSGTENDTLLECELACANSTDADIARAQCAHIDPDEHIFDYLACGCAETNVASARVLQCEKACGKDIADSLKLCDLLRNANRSSCPGDAAGSAPRNGELPSAVAMAVALLLVGSAAVAVL